MLLLKVQRAIAYIRTVMGVATPTHNAGLAHPEPTQPAGNSNSAQGTQRRRQPVQTEQKPKRKRAPSTTQGASRKQELTSAKQTAIRRGRPRKTPV